ncbi:MAG: AI-2E family transporter [Melioribacteraceae bacterium]|nr:AI-2E family transporter [Melioribacteraceae bacterium]
MENVNKTIIEMKESHSGMRFLIIMAALVIIIAGINLAQSIVVLFLVSFFMAILATPPVLWLRSKHIPSGFAVFIVMSVMIIILLLISAQIGSSFGNFSDELPLLLAKIREQIIKLSMFLTSNGIVAPRHVLLEYVNSEAVMELITNALTGFSSVLSNLILILLSVTFILLEVPSFPIKLRSILGDPEQAFPQFTIFLINMKRYMVIKTIINIIAAIIIGIWMYILGVPYPVLWGFLAFLLHYIPNIGSVLAAIPPVLLALVELGMGSAFLVILGNIVVGFIVGNVVEPRLMGRQLGLSTLVVFLSLIFWGSILGLVGAILCIPLTMTMKFAFENIESTQWIAVLLGPEDQTAPLSIESEKDNVE